MKVDLIIANGLILTLNTSRTILNNGVLIVDKGRIIDVGDQSLLTKYNSTKVIDADKKLVMPGLINTHTHTGNTMFRGIADDRPLMDWLNKFIFPLETKFCNRDMVTLSAKLSIMEMIKSGTTTFCDMYYFEQDVARVAKDIGMRAVLAETVMDYPTPTVKNLSENFRYSEELIETWKNDSLIKIAVAPHAPYTNNGDTLKKAKQFADKNDLGFFINLAETEQEVLDSLKMHKLTPVEFLESLGVLQGDVFAVHCVHLSENDKQIFQKNNIGVSYNAISNMKLASGVAPICDLIKRGVVVGIGTDGAASNNTLNMFEEMDMGSKLQKVFTKDASVLNAQTVVEMATLNGAKLLNLESSCGSIEIGKQADVIVIDLNLPHLLPLYSIYSQIVYAMNGSEVDTVIINGQIVMEERQLKTIEEERVLYEVKKFSEKIVNTF